MKIKKVCLCYLYYLLQNVCQIIQDLYKKDGSPGT